MKKKHYLALAFMAVASLLASLPVSALSVADYLKENGDQQEAAYNSAVEAAIKTGFQADKDFGALVGDYFTNVPQGSSQTKGYIAFLARLEQVKKDAASDPGYLKKAQVEGIINDIVNVDILNEYAKEQSEPQKAAPIVQTDNPSISDYQKLAEKDRIAAYWSGAKVMITEASKSNDNVLTDVGHYYTKFTEGPTPPKGYSDFNAALAQAAQGDSVHVNDILRKLLQAKVLPNVAPYVAPPPPPPNEKEEDRALTGPGLRDFYFSIIDNERNYMDTELELNDDEAKGAELQKAVKDHEIVLSDGRELLLDKDGYYDRNTKKDLDPAADKNDIAEANQKKQSDSASKDDLDSIGNIPDLRERNRKTIEAMIRDDK